MLGEFEGAGHVPVRGATGYEAAAFEHEDFEAGFDQLPGGETAAETGTDDDCVVHKVTRTAIRACLF